MNDESDINERMALAFREVFSKREIYFGSGPASLGGGDDYFGVDLDRVAPDGSTVDLVLIFRSARRYCCFEFVCHFHYYHPAVWRQLRAAMDHHGLENLSLPTIRQVRGVIEAGAIGVPSPRMPMFKMEAKEYLLDGPFSPILSE